jgi:phage baseplate assembly protein W
MAINQHIYSDLDLTFLPSPATGDVSMKYDEQAVIRSIRNLLNTNLYDRLFQPDVGSTLNQLLFEPVSPLTATLIQNEIVRTLTNYEPRARINSLVVSANPDSNQFNVALTVFVGNQTSPTAINLILQRTR